jgi:hypothetical protein
MNFMDIIKEVGKLGFPKDRYVVVGSGHLIALGLKEGKDVDILVDQKLFDKCIKEGWEVLPWTYPGTEGQIYLRKGVIELYLNVSCGDAPNSDELIRRAVFVKGIPFAHLEDILKLKKEYSKTKPKHLKDIELIENYLSNQKD